MKKTAFIIDIYNPYSPYNSNVRSIFYLNEHYYCIREIECHQGCPVIQLLIDDETQPNNFHIYDTFEEAQNFVHILKKLNK